MKAWEYLLRILGIIVSINLFGCATHVPDYSLFIQEANSRYVPILIYNTSWNNPKGGGGRLAIWVANVQDKTIQSIDLAVAVCGAKGSAGDPMPLILGGPFVGQTNYVSLPSWPIDIRSYTGTDDSNKEATQSPGHMLIQSIKIVYSDGAQETYDKMDLDQLLTKNISNYCTTNIYATF